MASHVAPEALLHPSAFAPCSCFRWKLPTTLNTQLLGQSTILSHRIQKHDILHLTLSCIYCHSKWPSFWSHWIFTAIIEGGCYFCSTFSHWLTVKWSDLPNDTQLETVGTRLPSLYRSPHHNLAAWQQGFLPVLLTTSIPAHKSICHTVAQ